MISTNLRCLSVLRLYPGLGSTTWPRRPTGCGATMSRCGSPIGHPPNRTTKTMKMPFGYLAQMKVPAPHTYEDMPRGCGATLQRVCGSRTYAPGGPLPRTQQAARCSAAPAGDGCSGRHTSNRPRRGAACHPPSCGLHNTTIWNLHLILQSEYAALFASVVTLQY